MRARFEEFVLDAEEQRLSRRGEPVLLRGKPFALLCLLVRHAGQLVRRDTIIEELWGEVVVGEHGLSVCVSEVRAALGEAAKAPRLIQTVHRAGYRFVGELLTDGAETVSLHEPLDPDEAGRDVALYGLWTEGRPILERIELIAGVREIGRGPLGAFQLTDPAASREHARVTCIDGRLRVFDHGSRNGSVVDGRVVRGSSATARDGSVLRIAETVFLLTRDRTTAEAASAFLEALAVAVGAGTRLRAAFVARALAAPVLSPSVAVGLAARVRGRSPELGAADYPED